MDKLQSYCLSFEMVTLNIENKVIIIVGIHDKSIENFVKTLAKNGNRIVLGDTSLEKLKKLQREIAKEYGNVIFRITDSSSEKDIRNLQKYAVYEFGKIDLWFYGSNIDLSK